MSLVRATQAPSPAVFVKRSAPVPTAVYDTYWRFAAERHRLFESRYARCSSPWTVDPILLEHKFTNAFRVNDRVSQYLVANVLIPNAAPDEIFFRVLLFKLFNRIGTWELLSGALGETPSLRTFNVAHYVRILNRAFSANTRLYSAAYIMPMAPGYDERRKHASHLRLLADMLEQHVPDKVAAARSMHEAFILLRAWPMMGAFLSYQYVTDFNYSDAVDFSEMEFVVPGPGAQDGLQKCFRSFGDYEEADVIRWVADRQSEEFAARGLANVRLFGRPLQLIDCQNLFCEVGKYARVAHPDAGGTSGRTRIKQRYRENLSDLPYVYPAKWKLGMRPRPSADGEHE